MKVLITGAGGYMGRNLARLFHASLTSDVVALNRQKLNLLDDGYVKTKFREVDPDIVIHAAIKGGTVLDVETLQNIEDNVQMFESVMKHSPKDSTIFIIGSGAEFDRRQDIDCVRELDLFKRYPVDAYGIAKNIIARRALEEHDNTYVIRLFGCFNDDLEDFRFIKKCSNSIQTDDGFGITQNRMMDFFYMDDIYTVIINLIQNGGVRNMNLVYNQKYSLVEIAKMVYDLHGADKSVLVRDPRMDKPYTGCGDILNKRNLPLIGLKEGLRRTCNQLHFV